MDDRAKSKINIVVLKQKVEKPLPLLMKLSNFDFEGVGTIQFNQKVQTLFKVPSENSRRRNLADDGLIEMNPETLALTVFNFRLQNEDGHMETKGISGIGIKEWNEE